MPHDRAPLAGHMKGERIDLRTRIPTLRGQRLHIMPSSDERPLRRVLAETGFEVLTLAGSAIRNESSLFDEIARGLELGDDFGRNWDALTDALGELEERPSARIAIVWVDADQSVAADLQAFLGAVRAFDHAAADLGSITDEGEAPRQIEVFLLGSRAGFPSIP